MTQLFVYSINTLHCPGEKDEGWKVSWLLDAGDMTTWTLDGNGGRKDEKTKRETFQQAIKYILDAFCESFAAGLWRCNFLNVSDVAVDVVIFCLFCSFSLSFPLYPWPTHFTSILIAKYGDNFKEVKDIDAPWTGCQGIIQFRMTFSEQNCNKYLADGRQGSKGEWQGPPPHLNPPRYVMDT